MTSVKMANGRMKYPKMTNAKMMLVRMVVVE